LVANERELKKTLLERLVLYCHFLESEAAGPTADHVSSVEIADYADIDESQVRKDFAAIGVRGTPRVGYEVSEITHAIQETLGFDRGYRAAVVGAGRLGSALVCYPGFARYGLHVVAAFDKDPNRLGERLCALTIEPIENIREIITTRGVELGIITVPARGAQDAAERLVDAGVRAVWNFAPTGISVPEGVRVRHEHLSVGLAELAYHLNRQRRTRSAAS
jgi:redox-sensing transcriptional repressor